MKYYKFQLIIIVLLFSFFSNAQKEIKIDEVYSQYKFWAKSLPGFNFMKDGKSYSKVKDGNINTYNIINGALKQTIFDSRKYAGKNDFSGDLDDYTFSEMENKILIESESEVIYRHSSRVNCHVYDVKSGMLKEVFGHGKISNPALSPDGEKIAFVFKNNMYFKNLNTDRITMISKDGLINRIINGMSDWVYEEEFSFTRAFYWSPDSKKIAYLRFDESKVPEYTIQLFKDEVYPVEQKFKYPKVGERSSEVSIHVYEINTGKSRKYNFGEANERYIPRVKWTQNADKLCVMTLNLHQNELKLNIIDTKTKHISILLEEKNKYYIDIQDDLTFLQDGKHFIWSSEKEGYHQLYLYGLDGLQKAKLTKGSYDVTAFYGVDQINNKLYFQAAEKSPMQKHVFAVDLQGENLTNLTPSQHGSNFAQFNQTFDFFSNTLSTINIAPTYTIYDRNGKTIKVLEDNAAYPIVQREYGVGMVDFFQFTTDENIKLNGWMMKPKAFDPSRKYPVFMTQYSGPGSQTVVDEWNGWEYWWYQMLAQKGYIVVSVDGRGTGGRGEEFEKMTYLQLGYFETFDQIASAKYLGTLSYVDKLRIGIYGSSYGGFLSSLCILKGNDVFKTAISVSPVTNWKWYDNIYTERYMRTVKENEKGYFDNSPVNFADGLKGNFLLIHGMADDNVHFQHSAELTNALIKANKQFDTYFYPNRNHGIFGDNATIHLYTKMTNFIFEKL